MIILSAAKDDYTQSLIRQHSGEEEKEEEEEEEVSNAAAVNLQSY